MSFGFVSGSWMIRWSSFLVKAVWLATTVPAECNSTLFWKMSLDRSESVNYLVKVQISVRIVNFLVNFS